MLNWINEVEFYSFVSFILISISALTTFVYMFVANYASQWSNIATIRGDGSLHADEVPAPTFRASRKMSLSSQEKPSPEASTPVGQASNSLLWSTGRPIVGPGGAPSIPMWQASKGSWLRGLHSFSFYCIFFLFLHVKETFFAHSFICMERLFCIQCWFVLFRPRIVTIGRWGWLIWFSVSTIDNWISWSFYELIDWLIDSMILFVVDLPVDCLIEWKVQVSHGKGSNQTPVNCSAQNWNFDYCFIYKTWDKITHSLCPFMTRLITETCSK